MRGDNGRAVTREQLTSCALNLFAKTMLSLGRNNRTL